MTTMATSSTGQTGGQVLVPQDVFSDILGVVTKVLPVVLSFLSAPGPGTAAPAGGVGPQSTGPISGQSGGQVAIPQDLFGDIINVITKVLPVVLNALSAPGPAARQA